MKTIIHDRMLWSEVKISQPICEECGTADSIVIKKEHIKKLIKILQKLDYRGVPKNHLIGQDKEYVIGIEKTWAKVPKRKITLNKRKKERMKGGIRDKK